MRKLTILFLLPLLVVTAGENKNLGLGLMLGSPTGLSVKYWNNSITSINGAAAWSFKEEEAFHLHADYVLHSFGFTEVEKGSLPFYFGIGGRLQYDKNKDINLGIRVPLGLVYIFETAPLDSFLEIVPTLELYPATDLDFDAAIGMRFFFANI